MRPVIHSEPFRSANAPDAQTEFYWQGDLCRYTGKSLPLHGALFYEFRFLEGHRIGQMGVTQRPPMKA